MNATLDRLKAKCDALTQAERAELVRYLILSLDPEDEGEEIDGTAFVAGLERRIAEIRSGAVTGVPAGAAFASLRASSG